MAAITIRQIKGASIVNIPKAVVKALGLKVGSKLDMTVKNNQIVLTPIKEKPVAKVVVGLKALLMGSPKGRFQIEDEDYEWLDDAAKGKEF